MSQHLADSALIALVFTFCCIPACAAAQTTEKPQPGDRLLIDSARGKIAREVTDISAVSFKYRNANGQIIESIYGIVEINVTAGHMLSDAQRSRIIDLSRETPQSVKFQFTGNSGQGDWTRSVSIDVADGGILNYKDTAHPILKLSGTVQAPGFYNQDFECNYAKALGVCLSSYTRTYSRRNPSSNGETRAVLFDIQR